VSCFVVGYSVPFVGICARPNKSKPCS